MSVFSNPKYLLEKQYRTDDNLQEVEGIRELVAEEIARNGSFHVTKSTGLFRCLKP